VSGHKANGGGGGIAARPASVEADTGQGPPETAPSPGQPALAFEVSGVAAIKHAAAPTLSFTLDVEEESGLSVFTAALTIQIQIEPIKRRYEREERERLAELFGEPHRWSTSAQRMLWTTEAVLLPAFSGNTSVEVPVQCNYDLELAATRYFNSIEGNGVPLSFHFNGSVYYAGEDERLQIVQVPWDTVANYRMPLGVWKEMIDAYYPYRAWLPLQRETLDRLRKRKSERGLPTYDQTLLELLEEAEG
jgi:hypothetical protein